MKKVIISVTNDLTTDKRVAKTAVVLKNLGFDVLLLGRRNHNKVELSERSYNTKRLKLIFNKGPLFYAEYNFKLFFYLLFHSVDLLVANDLDTLLPNYLAYKIKNIGRSTNNYQLTTNLVYDTHEYFTGVPELSNRKFVKNFWKTIEKTCFPYLNDIITVNDSIARLYKNEYGKELKVVRNITPKINIDNIKSREKLGLPVNKRIIILQGSVNIDRGLEEVVEAMQYVHGAILLIIGNGDIVAVIKEMIRELYLQERVYYLPAVPFEYLIQYTLNSDLGLTLEKDTNINYKYCLPNKLFDYIHAGVPVLASSLVEIENMIDEYKIGETIDNHDPKHIAAKINSMLSSPDKILMWKKNLKIAATELCWEKEEKKLIEIFEKYK